MHDHLHWSIEDEACGKPFSTVNLLHLSRHGRAKKQSHAVISSSSASVEKEKGIEKLLRAFDEDGLHVMCVLRILHQSPGNLRVLQHLPDNDGIVTAGDLCLLRISI